MRALETTGVSPDQQDAAAWAAVLLHAIAREEAASRLPPRLTEAGFPTWNRFKGRLTPTDFLELLFEDAAVLHPIPFAASAVDVPGGAVRLPSQVVEKWLGAVPHLDLAAAPGEYITEQARLLGVPSRMARSDLHVLKAHHKVLELPGSGGQLAHHLVTTQKDLTLQANFTIACGNWRELTLAGVVALACGAPSGDFITRATPEALKASEHPLRQRAFDFVIGLAPEQGGQLKVPDQLAIWFPSAKFVLV